MFNTQSYSKGACLIRMLEALLTPTVFRDGVRSYLATHRYRNAVSTDLWAALQAASGVTRAGGGGGCHHHLYGAITVATVCQSVYMRDTAHFLQCH